MVYRQNITAESTVELYWIKQIFEKVLDDPDIPKFMRFFATRQYNAMKLLCPHLKDYKDYPLTSLTMTQKREATELLKTLGLEHEYQFFMEGIIEEEREALEDG